MPETNSKANSPGPNAAALIVDDEAQIRSWLGTVVGLYGYRVFVAQDGLEAAQFIEAFAATHPALELRLLITDWKMPNMSGPDLIQFVRASGQNHLPCVLMSGAVSAAELRSALESDVDAVILKPFVEPRLKEKIQEAVNRRAQRRVAKAG